MIASSLGRASALAEFAIRARRTIRLGKNPACKYTSRVSKPLATEFASIMPPTFNRALCLIAALCVGAQTSTRADDIELTSGLKLPLESVVDGDSIKIEGPSGTLVLPTRLIRERTAHARPERDWPSRLDAAKRQGANEQLQAAIWAIDHALIREGVAALRAIHAAEPQHQPTARMVAALEKLAAPCPAADRQPALASSLGRFETAAGPHIVISHQHSLSDVNERIQLLERVLMTFYLDFAALGIDLPPPRHRLRCLWFSRQAEYQAYLRAHGAAAFLNTRGHYNPSLNVVAFYDARDDAAQRRARAELDRRISELAAARPANSNDEILLLEARSLALDAECRELDLSVAAHEFVHQLIDNSTLCPRPGAFPKWLSEGLAMQYEPVRATRWGGPGGFNRLRDRDWSSLNSYPNIEYILNPSTFARGYRENAYAGAWVLVRHLRSARPGAFVALFDALRAPTPSHDRPELTARQALEASFGAEFDELREALKAGPPRQD